ncbi:hypothetical protein BVRB_8g197360 [Beta vulgaris subsp. vulgaris]|nr:hypothetical protein BVRB_8g197360 [Beta vulgaris subsp. vulgaris]
MFYLLQSTDIYSQRLTGKVRKSMLKSKVEKKKRRDKNPTCRIRTSDLRINCVSLTNYSPPLYQLS